MSESTFVVDEQVDALLNFMNLAKRKFERGSFFKLYKFVLLGLRVTENDINSLNQMISFCIETFEHVLTKKTKCPNCNTHYQFRHIITGSGWHCIEINCDSCGDLYNYSEDKESESHFNIKVISKISSYKRRGKGLKLKTFKGGPFQKTKLVWTAGDDLPTLWINLDQVRSPDEVKSCWEQAKKEVTKRERLPNDFAG